jgi:hypothetical protein
LERTHEEVHEGKAEGEGCCSSFNWLYDCYAEGKESYDSKTWIVEFFELRLWLSILFSRLLQYAVAAWKFN